MQGSFRPKCCLGAVARRGGRGFGRFSKRRLEVESKKGVYSPFAVPGASCRSLRRFTPFCWDVEKLFGFLPVQ